MIRTILRSGENSEKLIQRFKRSVSKEGILKECKKRKFYEKPSQARRRRVREQEKQRRKQERKKIMKEARVKARRRK